MGLGALLCYVRCSALLCFLDALFGSWLFMETGPIKVSFAV